MNQVERQKMYITFKYRNRKVMSEESVEMVTAQEGGEKFRVSSLFS